MTRAHVQRFSILVDENTREEYERARRDGGGQVDAWVTLLCRDDTIELPDTDPSRSQNMAGNVGWFDGSGPPAGSWRVVCRMPQAEAVCIVNLAEERAALLVSNAIAEAKVAHVDRAVRLRQFRLVFLDPVGWSRPPIDREKYPRFEEGGTLKPDDTPGWKQVYVVAGEEHIT